MTYVYLAATPEVDPQPLAAIRDRAMPRFGFKLRELRLEEIRFAYEPERGQYGSVPMLGMLARNAPPDARKLLAVTERDLFIPVLTFVFGHALLAGRVGVVSLARLRQEFYGLAPDREVLAVRAVKEALHETGHMFGLVHCTDRNCAMSLATNVRQIDGKQADFCVKCAARLPKAGEIG
jgi:archaemetzincin